MFPQRHPIPASLGRLAAAARAGLFGTSALISGGAALATVGAVCLVCSGVLGQALLELGRIASLAPVSTLSPWDAVARCRGIAGWLLCLVCVPALFAALVAAALPALVRRRKRGSTAVPLPEMPRASLDLLAVRIVAALVAGLLLVRVVLSVRHRLSGDFSFELIGALADSAASFLVSAGAVMLLSGVVEAALRDFSIRRALSLTRHQARREERATGRSASRGRMFPRGDTCA